MKNNLKSRSEEILIEYLEMLLINSKEHTEVMYKNAEMTLKALEVIYGDYPRRFSLGDLGDIELKPGILEFSDETPAPTRTKINTTVKRVSEIETDEFEIGDVISFAFTDGEEVEAMAIRKEKGQTLFLLVDCLKTEYPMNSEDTNAGGYEKSDLRKKLNTEIIERFPSNIKNRLKPIDGLDGDLLRLPTEKEIFGVNEFGESEGTDIEKFEPMKLQRNRVASDEKNGGAQWYWLQNRACHSAANFAGVTNYGGASYYVASYSLGVRPAFSIVGS